MSTILVLGASGYIGSHLVPQLAAAGHRVRAASRHREVLEARGWTGVEIVQADALSAASLDTALAGIEVAYYLVHSMASGSDYAERDRRAAFEFREAAARAGVRRIVFLGGLQPTTKASEHLASRAETGEVLRGGTVPVTELRAGIIVGPGSAAFEVIRDLVNHLRVMIAPRWVRSRTQPISLDDLLAYLEGVITIEEAAGGIYDVGGAETLTYQQLMKQYAQEMGRRILVIPVPVLTPRLSSYWLDLVTAVPTSIARPLVEGLTLDLLADDRAIRALLPISLHGYREAVVAAIEAERTATLSGHWAEAALPYPGFDDDASFFSKNERADAVALVAVDQLWDEVTRIGGDNGWYAYPLLWQLRGAIDRLFGGPGMRRRRRHPTELRVGDVLDFWRVVQITPGRQLTLMAEMKLPGRAILEFQLEPLDSQRSKLTTEARFHPAGTLGLLYWYALIPFHQRIFKGITHNLVARAEARTRR
jgi:uncharacterized protein YbjT (DUF2867 family)